MGRKIVKRITVGGVKRSVDVAATATTEIQVTKGSVWVTASGGLQRIDDRDSTFVPLQVPRVTGTNTNAHAYFTSDNRMPLSLFTRPDGDLGFTAGAVLKAPEDMFMIASSSLGRVEASGVVSEVLPWGASYGFQFSGPYFQALTDLDDADGRTAGATTAEVDSIGNLWLATDQDGLVGYGSGTW